jgi:hypothetical protein
MLMNTSFPSNNLKKKHNGLECHWVRECKAAKMIGFAFVGIEVKSNDTLTKPLGNENFH